MSTKTNPKERPERFECNGRRFDTLQAASEYANYFWRKTGIFVNIRGYLGRPRQ